jgi:hypothetical protein
MAPVLVILRAARSWGECMPNWTGINDRIRFGARLGRFLFIYQVTAQL